MKYVIYDSSVLNYDPDADEFPNIKAETDILVYGMLQFWDGRKEEILDMIYYEKDGYEEAVRNNTASLWKETLDEYWWTRKEIQSHLLAEKAKVLSRDKTIDR